MAATDKMEHEWVRRFQSNAMEDDEALNKNSRRSLRDHINRVLRLLGTIAKWALRLASLALMPVAAYSIFMLLLLLVIARREQIIFCFPFLSCIYRLVFTPRS